MAALNPIMRWDGPDSSSADAPLVGRSLTLTTWNLGYAGLGRDSDFIADGGRRLRAANGPAIDRTIDVIAAFLRAEAARGVDALLLQEAAESGFMTRRRDLLGRLDAALPSARRWYYPDVLSRRPPPPIGLSHGLATYAFRGRAAAHASPLPGEGGPLIGGLWRRYAALALRLFTDTAGAWTVINLHLAAFDRGGRRRRAQAAAALDLARTAAAAGDAVVLGGDWNHALAETAFPYEGPARCLDWIRRFPVDLLGPGWRLACDPSTPTVRALDRPYQQNRSFTAVIDGFVVSPGVEIIAVEGVDLGFEASDHHPVRLSLRRTK